MERLGQETKERCIMNLKGYNFRELKIFLALQKSPEIRGIIMSAMERFYPDDFLKFVDEY